MQTELNKIDVSITKAKIKSIRFYMRDDDVPNVSVAIDLLTSAGNVLTSIDLSTDSYNSNTKLNRDNIPAHIYSAIGTCLREMSSVCTRKINAINNLLEA